MPFSQYKLARTDTTVNQKKRLLVKIFIVIVIILLSVILSLLAPNLILKLLYNKLKLRPDSEGFTKWSDPPIQTTRTYYLFNVTNPLDIMKEPKKTLLEIKDTRGYAYDLKTLKKNISWLDDYKQISYQVERLITRSWKNSEATSDDELGTFLDTSRGMVRSQFSVKAADSFFLVGGDKAFSSEKPIDILEGYIPKTFSKVQDKMKGPNKDMFGFVYRQNGSRLYNVTSKTDLDEKGQMLNFASEMVSFEIHNDSHYLFPVYDGLSFPVSLFNKKRIRVFNSDFCRPVEIEYQDTVEEFGFSELHIYRLKLIDSDKCKTNNGEVECDEVDILDVSKCFSDSIPSNTLVLTKAHLYGANNSTVKESKVNGFHPDPSKHDSLIYFEPYTGTPIHATYRIQLNMNLFIDKVEEDEQHESERKYGKGVKRFIPMFWIDQRIEISEKTKILLRESLRIRKNYWIIIVFGILLAIAAWIIIQIMERCLCSYE